VSLKLIGYSRKRGVVTHPYPKQPIEVDEHYRGKPELEFEKCMGCGACANACPADAITIETLLEKGVREWSIYYGRCIFCGRCQEVCPLTAITLTQEFELAATSREDLMVRAEFKLAACSECGATMDITERQIAVARAILSCSRELPDLEALLEAARVCSECKRKSTAEKIIEATKAYGGGV